jgi:predicted O-methyltransferase YrrM
MPVHLPEQDLTIFTIPKNGGTTVMCYVYYIRKGGQLPRGNVYDEKWLAEGKALGESLIIRRDPVERFVSGYRNFRDKRGLRLDFDEFVGVFPKLYENDLDIKHHFRSQESYFPGMPLSAIDYVVDFHSFHEVKELLEAKSGLVLPDIHFQRSVFHGFEVKEGHLSFIREFFAKDYEAGFGSDQTFAKACEALLSASPGLFGSRGSPPTAEPPRIPLEKYRDDKSWGWYRMVPAIWLRWVASCHPVKALEIGAFDGVSANVMLDAIFPHPESTVDTIDPYLPDPCTLKVCHQTRDLFEENTRRGGHAGRVRLHVGTSREVLTRMWADGGVETFDRVFIDGSHLAADVITDAVLAWPLLKPGGILIFDDFEWGEDLPKHRRPREAVQAFEAAFIEYLVPLWQGYQRIYRKTGVPGGLKNRVGNPLQANVVIVGTYDSGSSLLSSVMECLGFAIGRPAWYDFFESTSLRELMTRAIDEAGMVPKMEAERLVNELRKWFARIKPFAPALCVKHPMLGLCLSEIEEAWGPDTIFLRARRPLEESIRGLRRRDWFSEPEWMQRLLNEEIEAFFSVGRPAISVEHGELLAYPEAVIRRLAAELEIELTEDVLERAVGMVRIPGE